VVPSSSRVSRVFGRLVFITSRDVTMMIITVITEDAPEKRAKGVEPAVARLHCRRKSKHNRQNRQYDCEE
jgi:hypothetical protein